MLDDMHIRRLVSVLDNIIWAQEGDTSKNDWEKINAAKAELNDLIQTHTEEMLPYIILRGRERRGLIEGLEQVDDPIIRAFIPYWTKPDIKADLEKHPPTPRDPKLTAYLIQRLQASDRPPQWIYDTLEEVADESAVEPLLARLQHTDDEKLIRQIHEILVGIGGEQVTDYYLKSLETEPSAAAIVQLGKLGELSVLKTVCDLLLTTDLIPIKGGCLSFLNNVRDEQALDVAFQFAMRADELVGYRKSAVKAIYLTGGQKALKMLEELLEAPAAERKLLRAVNDGIEYVTKKINMTE